MSLMQLPQEIMILIIQHLDTQTVYSLYDTCIRFRNIVAAIGVVKECHLSLNNIATVKTLKTDFFLDICSHLTVLNLCGAPDVRKSYVIPALRKTKNLLSLDVSFTHITLIDFIEIYKVCPSLKNISLNFMIAKSGLSRLSEDSIEQCQKTFKNMKNIHLVGSVTNLLYSKVVLLLLQDADLDLLKYTVAESDRLHTVYVPQKAESAKMVKFKRFFLCFLDWSTVYAFFGSFFMLPVLSILEIGTIEAIIMIKQNLKQYCIHTSPAFKNYFQETFDIECDKIYTTEYKDAIIGNAVIMIWNKNAHTFDKAFYDNLTRILKPFFPCDCDPYVETEEIAPSSFDWFYITPICEDNKLEKLYVKPKKKRMAPSHVALNYDHLFKSKRQLELSLVFDAFIQNPVTISPNFEYLSKLTFLSITGSIRFTSDFYPTLFKACTSLITLNLEAPAISPCVLALCRSIHHTKTLKNLRFTDKQIDFNALYAAFAKVPTLENLHLVEGSSVETCSVGDPTDMFEECQRLYSFFMEVPLSDNAVNKIMHRWNNLKSRMQKNHLHLVVHSRSDMNKLFYSYDPFVSVFHLNPIKQLEC